MLFRSTIPVGSGSVRVKYDDATPFTRLAGSVTLGTPVADLSGTFAVEATGTSPNQRILIAASGVTGFVGDKKGTPSANDDTGVVFTSGDLLAVINANGTYALDASGAAGLVGVAGLTLNGTLAGQKNTTGAAVNESITVGGVTRTLAVPKDAAKVEGSLTLGAEGVLYLSGNFGVEKKDATLTLADGSTVLTTAIQIGASSLTGFAGINAAPGSADQTGVSITGGSFGLTLAAPKNSNSGTDLRTWTALKANLTSASLVGVDVATASVSNLTLNMNRAGGTLNGTAATTTADFEAAPLTNTVGGQSSTLDFKGNLLRATALIEFGVSGFADVRGRFGIEFGDMDVKIAGYTGPDLPTKFIKFWGIDVDASIGINGPAWTNSDFTGFQVAGLDFNLMLNMRNPLSAVLPDLGSMKWFTLKAALPEITFAPFLELKVPDLNAIIPTLSLNLTYDVPALSTPTPWIDYAATLPNVALPALPAMPNFPGLPSLPAVPAIPTFAFTVPPKELLEVNNLPAINLFDFLAINGSLTVKRTEYTATLNDGTSVPAWALVMNSVNGGFFAGINGPATNSDATGLAVSNVNGALAVLIPKDATDKRRWVAASGTGNSVALLGLPELTMSASNIAVELNKPLGTTGSGSANTSIVNFTGNALSVLMDDGSTEIGRAHV